MSSTYFSRYKWVRVSLYYIENIYTQYRSYRLEVFNLPLDFSRYYCYNTNKSYIGGIVLCLNTIVAA